jgi:hypothetical protein
MARALSPVGKDRMLARSSILSLNIAYSFFHMQSDHRACSISNTFMYENEKHLAFTVSGGTFEHELEWELG